MALIDKDTIRAEIERQRQFIEGLFTESDNSFYDGQDDVYNHILAFLDALPEQPAWKPSEEQIRALKYAIDKWESGQGVACPSSFKYHNITELYEQLKKL